MDDAFARLYGAENLEKLRDGVRRDLENELNYSQAKAIRTQVIRGLLDRVNFDLPESAVAQETRNAVYDIVRQNTKRGITREMIEQQKEQIYSAATYNAKERVKLSFLIQRIAEKEEIKVSQEEILKRAQSLAALYQIPLEKFLKDLQKRDGVPELYEQILHEKALDLLEKNAVIEDVPPSTSPAPGGNPADPELTIWLPPGAPARLRFDESRRKPQHAQHAQHHETFQCFFACFFPGPGRAGADGHECGHRASRDQRAGTPTGGQYGRRPNKFKPGCHANGHECGHRAGRDQRTSPVPGTNADRRHDQRQWPRDVIAGLHSGGVAAQSRRANSTLQSANFTLQLRAAYSGYDPAFNISGKHSYDMSAGGTFNQYSTNRSRPG